MSDDHKRRLAWYFPDWVGREAEMLRPSSWQPQQQLAIMAANDSSPPPPPHTAQRQQPPPPATAPPPHLVRSQQRLPPPPPPIGASPPQTVSLTIEIPVETLLAAIREGRGLVLGSEVSMQLNTASAGASASAATTPLTTTENEWADVQQVVPDGEEPWGGSTTTTTSGRSAPTQGTASGSRVLQ